MMIMVRQSITVHGIIYPPAPSRPGTRKRQTGSLFSALVIWLLGLGVPASSHPCMCRDPARPALACLGLVPGIVCHLWETAWMGKTRSPRCCTRLGLGFLSALGTCILRALPMPRGLSQWMS